VPETLRKQIDRWWRRHPWLLFGLILIAAVCGSVILLSMKLAPVVLYQTF